MLFSNGFKESVEVVGGPAVKRQQLAKGPSDSIDSALLSAAIFIVVPQLLRERSPWKPPAVYTTLLSVSLRVSKGPFVNLVRFQLSRA